MIRLPLVRDCTVESSKLDDHVRIMAGGRRECGGTEDTSDSKSGEIMSHTGSNPVTPTMPEINTRLGNITMRLQTLCILAMRNAVVEKRVWCVVHDGMTKELRIINSEVLTDSPFRFTVLAKMYPAAKDHFTLSGETLDK